MAEFDVKKLLLPIRIAEPAGDWLRYTEVYDQVQEARRADDPSLPQGIWQKELKKADWDRLAAVCEEAIERRSKDLYLAVWLVEAWLHRHGVAGVAAGMELLEGLCRDFWDDLYPHIDPDDPDVRSAPFEWLNDKLPVALGILSVSNPGSPEVAAYSWADLLAVRAGAVGNPTEASAGLSAARVQSSVSLTPAGWLRDLEAQTSRALDATQRVISLLRELSPDAPPSLRRIEEALQELQRWLRTTLADRPGSAAAAPTPEAIPTPAEDPAMPQTEIVLGGDAVRSREQAYRLLAVAAEYLLRTEPHSPTPYLVQRAVSWGRMPLAELLEEYGRDGNDLRALRALLGLGEES